MSHGTAIGCPGRRVKGSPPLGHGTRQHYASGCRCADCRAAQSSYRRAMRSAPQRHCADCGAPISKSKQTLCAGCRPKSVPPAPVPRVACAGGCGKQMVITSASPTCQACRAERRAAEAPKPTHKIRTHCTNGHEYTPENTRITAGGARRCRECDGAYQRRYVEAGRRPKIRGSKPYRRLKTEFRAECATADLPCWICGESIDYAVAHPNRMAFEADHVLSVKSHPERGLDRSNLAPSHAKCNRSRGATHSQSHAAAKAQVVFLLKELEQAKQEIADLREALDSPAQLRLIS